MSEGMFRKVMAKLVRPNEVLVPTEPLRDVLAAFRTIIHQDVSADDALFRDVAMDSLDLIEVTIALDEVYGERDWQPLFEQAGTRFAINQQPALTPRMMAEYLELPNSHSAKCH